MHKQKIVIIKPKTVIIKPKTVVINNNNKNKNNKIKPKNNVRINNNTVFRRHPILHKYECNRQGDIKNVRSKHILKSQINKYSYHRIGFSNNNNNNNKRKYYTCHRFVWETFNGILPEEYQINHINTIKTDNRLENLELEVRKRRRVKKGDDDEKKGKKVPAIMVIAINTETSETFKYDSLTKAGKSLRIHWDFISKYLKGEDEKPLYNDDNVPFEFKKLQS